MLCYTFSMEIWQGSVLILVFLYSTLCFLLGWRNCKIRKNPFGLSRGFTILGAFVWIDAVTFGAFFALSALLSFLLQDFILFCLIYSVFWVIRSAGESIYWFLEQFVDKHRNKPETLKGHKMFPGDAVYIHYQIFWQCVTVLSIIASVYFFSIWL